MEIKEIKKIVNKVEGSLYDREGQFLYSAAKNCKGRGLIVEIGSWKGKSTIWLARGSKAGNKVKICAIDPHTGCIEHRERNIKVWTFEEFRENIRNAKVDDIIVPMVKTSKEAAQDFKEPVEFVFVDGDHKYELVKLDFELWFPKLVKGGIMAFHDVRGRNGPRKVFREAICKSRTFTNIGLVESMGDAQKVKQNTARDRLRGVYVLFLTYLFEIGQKVRIPRAIRIFAKKIVDLIQ